MTHWSIGEVLAVLQEDFPEVTISKIRFLESQGLIAPERTPSGYRRFVDHDLDRIRWILVQQRDRYLPLRVIKQRLDNAGTPGAPDGFDEEGEGGLFEALRSMADERDEPDEADESERAGGVPKSGSTRPVSPRRSNRNLHVGGDADVVAISELRVDEEIDIVQFGADGYTPVGDPPEHPSSGGIVDDTDSLWQELATSIGRRFGSESDAENEAPVDLDADLEANPGSVPEVSALHEDPEASGAGRAQALHPSTDSADDTGEAGGDQAKSDQDNSDQARSDQTGTEAGDGVTPSAVVPSAESPDGSPADVEPSEPFAPVPPDLSAEAIEFTAEELAAASGCSTDFVEELVKFHLLGPIRPGPPPIFDRDGLLITVLAVRFAEFGLEPRHLRTFRLSAEREIGLMSQLVESEFRRRDASARRAAGERLIQMVADARLFHQAQVRLVLGEEFPDQDI